MNAKGEYICKTHCQVTVLFAPIVMTSVAALGHGNEAVDGDREEETAQGAVLHY